MLMVTIEVKNEAEAGGVVALNGKSNPEFEDKYCKSR
jgi:hypothetical protein